MKKRQRATTTAESTTSNAEHDSKEPGGWAKGIYQRRSARVVWKRSDALRFCNLPSLPRQTASFTRAGDWLRHPSVVSTATQVYHGPRKTFGDGDRVAAERRYALLRPDPLLNSSCGGDALGLNQQYPLITVRLDYLPLSRLQLAHGPKVPSLSHVRVCKNNP